MRKRSLSSSLNVLHRKSDRLFFVTFFILKEMAYRLTGLIHGFDGCDHHICTNDEKPWGSPEKPPTFDSGYCPDCQKGLLVETCDTVCKHIRYRDTICMKCRKLLVSYMYTPNSLQLVATVYPEGRFFKDFSDSD
jgi:hypothetical protein